MKFIPVVDKDQKPLMPTIPSGKEGKRKRFGETLSLGLKRGSVVKHSKYGLIYIGGYVNNRISLHEIETGKRLYRSAKPKEIKTLTNGSWRYKNLKWEVKNGKRKILY